MVVADSGGKDCNSHQEWPILREDIPSSCEGRKERRHFPAAALMYDKVSVCVTFLRCDTWQRNGDLVANKETVETTR